MNRHYILDEQKRVIPVDLMTWATWFDDTAKRRVAWDEVGDVQVSTVFIGLDHNFGTSGPPLVFETMIFGGPHSDYCERYSTWEDAMSGHAKALALISTVSQ